jgi:tricarballylate dehydrogenase
MALDPGAAVAGHWSGRTPSWDPNVPPPATRRRRRFQAQLPPGIAVNARRAFFDEGFSRHPTPNMAEIPNQPACSPGRSNQKVVHLLREEHRIPRITKGRPTVSRFGRAPERRPASLETVGLQRRPQTRCRSTRTSRRLGALAIDKATGPAPDQPPYEAYAVTTGITFTFGGLKITGNAEVEDTPPPDDPRAAGEIVGGLFFHNTPAQWPDVLAPFGRLAEKRGDVRKERCRRPLIMKSEPRRFIAGGL